MRNQLINRAFGYAPANRDYLVNRFDRILENFFNDDLLSEIQRPNSSGQRRSELQAFTPKIDIVSTKDALLVKADLPGLEEKDVEVSLDKEQLIIRGERQQEKSEEKGAEVYFERSHGQFERRIALPKGIDRNQVEADFKNGVLTVTIPKAKEAQEEIRRISINGAKAPLSNGSDTGQKH